MEREIGMLQASMDSLHDKVDGLEKRLVKEIESQDLRISKLEDFSGYRRGFKFNKR